MPAATTSKRASEGTNGESQELETWIEKMIDGKDNSVTKQVALGGVSGW